MAEYLYKEVEVTGSANTETTETILTGTADEQYIVDEICFTEVTGTLQHDANILAYREREKLMDIYYGHLMTYDGQDERLSGHWLEAGWEIGAGISLKVGQRSSSAASNFKVAVKYHLKS